MSMDRTPIKVTTPIEKHEVELKPFLIGAEKIELMNLENPAKAFAFVVVSVDGVKENIEEEVGKMHGKDFDFVLQKVAEVMEDSALEVKKNK